MNEVDVLMFVFCLNHQYGRDWLRLSGFCKWDTFSKAYNWDDNSISIRHHYFTAWYLQFLATCIWYLYPMLFTYWQPYVSLFIYILMVMVFSNCCLMMQESMWSIYLFSTHLIILVKAAGTILSTEWVNSSLSLIRKFLSTISSKKNNFLDAEIICSKMFQLDRGICPWL